MNKIKIRLRSASLVITMLLTLFAPMSAHATTLGGKWPYGGTFTLYYSYGGAHTYNGNIWQGAANWSATPTKVNISQWPGVPYRIDLDVVDQNNSATWWGLTVLNPCNTCSYTRSTIYMNTRTLGPESDFTRTKVATHEFGHSFGLAHPSGSATSVMNQGYLNYNKPQTYDINDTNRIYP